MMRDHGFLGVPKETFDQAGREQLILLLQAGLLPESKVVEFGCGCLRVASWLIPFLEPGNYYGIEPATDRVELGKSYLLDTETLDVKKPRFHSNAEFDTSVFSCAFDFFVARSIWTHASKTQIEQTLDSFLRDAAEDAVFLASYLPASTEEDDYKGDSWVGTSHESNVPGVVRHSRRWIEAACRSRRLRVDDLGGGPDCDNQYWLQIQQEP